MLTSSRPGYPAGAGSRHMPLPGAYGILARKYGVTFAPAKLAKTFSVPKDLILPDYESPVPFEQLLDAIRPTLTGLGLGYRLDAAGKKLTIVSVASELEAAA